MFILFFYIKKHYRIDINIHPQYIGAQDGLKLLFQDKVSYYNDIIEDNPNYAVTMNNLAMISNNILTLNILVPDISPFKT